MDIKNQRKYLKLILAVLGAAIGYAVVRYNVVGTVAWKDVPIFILNKAISLAAIVLLVFSFSIKPLINLGMPTFNFGLKSRKIWGITGLFLTIFHVLLSFLIFSPHYYPKFFEDDTSLSIIGNFSMVAGVVSFLVLGLYHWCFKNRSKGKIVLLNILTSRMFLFSLLFMFGVHLFFMGYSSWLTPIKWQGGLPPISLLSFLVVLFGFFVNGIERFTVKKFR